MAAQASPSTAMYPHHLAQRPQPNGHVPIPPAGAKTTASLHLASMNEDLWLHLGSLSETMGELESATQAYERALNFNANSVRALSAISCILRAKDQFPAAVEYLRQILRIEQNNGEVWSSLGHCYLMMDDLQQAYSAYQQALYHLPDPKEPKLWYGIGILYDRYGSLEHAEEAFSQVMRMEPNFEKANEIYFRLGIIYKQQQKFQQSLECFKYIVADPPRPLSEEDIWFQIGHVHEQQKDYDAAKGAYMRVLERDANHAKVLQQLGWLHHQQSTSFSSQEQAIEYLEKSVAADNTDAQSWYLLGRCYMSQQKYPKAYEAYQQAVYRDGKNPTFWCSIGVLYYQINQYRDALDAYSRAIRLNPNISEVWYDLGTLYESCNNQTNDALDAYTRAAELDPSNVHIKARLALLKGQPTTGLPNQGNAPLPQDVHPQAYQPGALGGPPGPQWGAPNQGPPPGPPPPALAAPNEWSRRLADVRAPGAPVQQLNPYDDRDRLSHNIPRQPSPRQEPPRTYAAEPTRPPPPSHRGLSPSPKVPYNTAAPYTPSAQPLPPPGQGPPHAGPPPPMRGGNVPYAQHAPPPPPGSMAAPPPQGALPPFNARPASPAPEVRPIVESAQTSPSGYPRHGYGHQHHPSAGTPSISSGAPPPAAALHAAEAAAREREERAPSAQPTKRHREWEDDSGSVKKQASEESRMRLEDSSSRRPSPPDRAVSPRRESSEMRRPEEYRPQPPPYHPSEAAHHPPAPPAPVSAPVRGSAAPSPRITGRKEPEQLPPPPRRENPTPVPASSQQAPPPAQASAPTYEPAARKMDVDENYDDSGDEEKRASVRGSKVNSPRGSTNGKDAANGHA